MAELPEYVRICGMCEGKGQYVQTYTIGCGMGYTEMMGRCDACDGTGYRYKDSAKRGGVPWSVVEQIRNAQRREA